MTQQTTHVMAGLWCKQHHLKDALEAVHQHRDLLIRRAKLMNDWKIKGEDQRGKVNFLEKVHSDSAFMASSDDRNRSVKGRRASGPDISR